MWFATTGDERIPFHNATPPGDDTGNVTLCTSCGQWIERVPDGWVHVAGRRRPGRKEQAGLDSSPG